MRGKISAQAACALAVVLSFLLADCGGPAGGPQLVDAGLGLTMDLPPNWRVDRFNRRTFVDREYPEDNFGLLEDYALEGKTLEEYLDEQLKGAKDISKEAKVEKPKPSRFGFIDTRLLSRKKRTISGLEAVEVVTEANYTVIEVVIKKGDRVIRVSMRAHPELYPKNEAAFRRALDSIKIKQ